MSVSNSSYIASNDELFNYLEAKYVYELLTQESTEVEEDLSQALSTDQQDRLNTALNWGKGVIVSGLRELYDLSSVTSANAPEVLKGWNARLALYNLEKRRARSIEGISVDINEIRNEIKEYATEDTVWSLDLTRNAAPIGTVRESKATQFDDGGQFDNIISSYERDDIWPDLANG